MTDVHPRGIPLDTSVDAWRVQMAALRGLPPEHRKEIWLQRQNEIESMERDSIRRSMPTADDRSLTAELVRRRYGIELARGAFPELDFDAHR